MSYLINPYIIQQTLTESAIATGNLVLHLDAKNPSSYPGSGTTWFDLSGNSFNGTLLNSPTYDSDGYFIFNGSSNMTVSIVSPNPNIAGQITSEIWFYASNSNSITLNHKGTHYSTYFPNTNTFQWADTNWSYGNFGTRSITNINQTGVWKQIVVTKDSSNNVRIYKNGALQDTRANFSPALSTFNSTLYLTGYSNDTALPSSNFLTGYISISRIYNRALSDSEVLQNFNAHRARYGL